WQQHSNWPQRTF
nr:immunoglobulin light chain junction region [Macaca mulatta]MPN99542.1 immunoglobulin light chain junction region [Macaca mulatta]